MDKRLGATSRGQRNLCQTAWTLHYRLEPVPSMVGPEPQGSHGSDPMPNVAEKNRRQKKCKQDLILQHMEKTKLEHTKLTKDAAQWCHCTAEWYQSQAQFNQRMLDVQQQQVAKQSEATAKLVTAVTEQMEVPCSVLQLQRDS